MGEILLMLLTGGGSTALGAVLKGGFGMLFESRRQKHELELARESRANENFIKLQAQLAEGGNGEFVSFSRRIIAFMGIGTLCVCVLFCTLFPSAEFLSITNSTEKAEQSGSSESLVTPQAKIRSSSRPAISPIWVTLPLWESSDFILVHRQGDK